MALDGAGYEHFPSPKDEYTTGLWLLITLISKSVNVTRFRHGHEN